MFMKRAFTLAEVLITLTIIGLVAVIVIPSLINDVYDKVWESKRQALYSRLSNAILTMPRLNGYGDYKNVTNQEGKNEILDTAAETFLIEGLSKVYKIKHICGSDDVKDCGLNYQFTSLDGTVRDFPTSLHSLYALNGDTKAAAFETLNGEKIGVFYNPNCRYSQSNATQIVIDHSFCVNFVYDLNGSKSPNQVGKDIGFMTAFLGTGIEPEFVAPLPEKDMGGGVGANVYYLAAQICKDKGPEYSLPNIYELMSLYLNNSQFIGSKLNEGVAWSSSVYSAGSNGRAWVYPKERNTAQVVHKSEGHSYYCIK